LGVHRKSIRAGKGLKTLYFRDLSGESLSVGRIGVPKTAVTPDVPPDFYAKSDIRMVDERAMLETLRALPTFTL
jgi:hypothetical protein